MGQKLVRGSSAPIGPSVSREGATQHKNVVASLAGERRAMAAESLRLILWWLLLRFGLFAFLHPLRRSAPALSANSFQCDDGSFKILPLSAKVRKNLVHVHDGPRHTIVAGRMVTGEVTPA